MVEGERSSNSGVYAILVIIVILILGVALYFSGMFGDRRGDGADVDINIEAPGGGGGQGGGDTGGTGGR